MKDNSNASHPDSEPSLRWHMLGLGTTDVGSSKNIDEFERELQKQIIGPTTDSTQRSKRLSRRTVVAMTSILLLTVLFFSVRLTVAHQNRRVSREYAAGLLNVVLGLYEEDLRVLEELSAKAEEDLPQVSLVGINDDNLVRMNFCATAIEGLTLVRKGFPEMGLERLDLAEETLLLQQESVEPHLNLAFHVIAGKACYEAIEITSGEINNASDLSFSFELSLRNALEIIDSGSVNLAKDQSQLLKAAILIDLARGLLKMTSPNSPDIVARYDKANKDLDSAHALLVQTKEKGRDWLAQYGRMINNRILLFGRQYRHNGEPTAGVNAIENFRKELLEFKGLANEAALDQEGRMNAVNFEIAMIYSNLADFAFYISGLGNMPVDVDLRKSELKFRSSATEYLSLIPRECQTVRHFENRVINRARRISTQVMTPSFTKDSISESLVHEAIILESMVGGDLLRNNSIGQLTPRSILSAAIVLSSKDHTYQEIYSLENIKSCLESKREWLIPSEQAWFDQWLGNQ